MAPLPKGPYVFKIDYQTTIGTQPITHTIELNCMALGNPAVGSAPTTVSMATRSGGNVLLSVAAQNFWTFFRAQLSATSTSLVNAQLFRYDGPSLGDVFISAVALTPALGAVAGTATAGHQIMLTFRTGGGRIMKLNWLESPDTAKTQSPLTANAAGTNAQKMAAYILSSEGWIAGRGGNWPVAPIRASSTYNEALERRRFRPNT